MMPFALRLLTDADLDELQGVYDARPDAFEHLIGRAALPDQAMADFMQGLATPGRLQFGIIANDVLIGVADLKLDDETVGQAHIGLLLLAPPYHDAEIAGLALRTLERGLAEVYGVTRIETSAVAHDAQGLTFWHANGYTFTGEQFRRELPGYAPRLLVLGKDLP